MQNPVQRIREAAGLGRADFAHALHIGYTTLHRAESGYVEKLNADMLSALADRGVDTRALEREYADWLTERGKAPDEQLRESIAAA